MFHTECFVLTLQYFCIWFSTTEWNKNGNGIWVQKRLNFPSCLQKMFYLKKFYINHGAYYNKGYFQTNSFLWQLFKICCYKKLAEFFHKILKAIIAWLHSFNDLKRISNLNEEVSSSFNQMLHKSGYISMPTAVKAWVELLIALNLEISAI